MNREGVSGTGVPTEELGPPSKDPTDPSSAPGFIASPLVEESHGLFPGLPPSQIPAQIRPRCGLFFPIIPGPATRFL